MKTIQCPSCGAAATNLQNCEFCGSLFVRYEPNNIVLDVSQENGVFSGFIFPNLESALKKNIELQVKSNYQENIIMDICLPNGDVLFQVVNSSCLADEYLLNPSIPGLAIYLAFDDEETVENRFLSIAESKLFKKSFFDGIPTYAIDFGKDVTGASYLVSKILVDVYEIDQNITLRIVHQDDSNDKSNKGKCFIATAAMGSYDHPQVMELRHFRDEWILEKSWGESFVAWYYHYGSIAAKSIEKSFVLKKICYLLIVKPLVFLSRIVNSK